MTTKELNEMKVVAYDYIMESLVSDTRRCFNFKLPNGTMVIVDKDTQTFKIGSL